MKNFRLLIWLVWCALPCHTNCMHIRACRTLVETSFRRLMSTQGVVDDVEAHIAILQLIARIRDTKPNTFAVIALSRRYQESLCLALGKCTKTKSELGDDIFADDPNAPCLCKRHGEFDTDDSFLVVEDR